MDLATKRCFVSRDVQFVEHLFPFHDNQNTTSASPYPTNLFPSCTSDLLSNDDPLQVPVVFDSHDDSSPITDTTTLNSSTSADVLLHMFQTITQHLL